MLQACPRQSWMPKQNTLGRPCALSAVGCRSLGFQPSSVAALCREAGHRVLHSPPTRQGMLDGSVLLSWRPHTQSRASAAFHRRSSAKIGLGDTLARTLLLSAVAQKSCLDRCFCVELRACPASLSGWLGFAVVCVLRQQVSGTKQAALA